MDIRNFRFGGTRSHNNPAAEPRIAPHARAAAAAPGDSLGPLALLPGTWEGVGFNQIWRPLNGAGSQDHFLELNQTIETLQFEEIAGDIPNRGLLQADINLRGIHYLQQISDAVVKDPAGQPVGLHLEPGLWLSVPLTTVPADPPTVARLSTIPHGTSILLQGSAQTIAGAPTIAPASITPFVIGSPGQRVNFPESNLATPSAFRTPAQDIPAVTQAMVDDPNTVLVQAISGQDIVATTTLLASTSTAQVAPPDSGGGTANTAFLVGNAGANQPNAQGVQVDTIFWIEQVRLSDGTTSLQLQYTQRVLLNFNGLSWPHVSVATLVKKA
jgi:hypothetical protein